MHLIIIYNLYKEDLALNNLEELIYHKPTKQCQILLYICARVCVCVCVCLGEWEWFVSE